MDADYRFTFGDQEGTKAWLANASLSPLSAGTTFTITLEAPNLPSTCARPSSMRALPALPFSVATQYTLTMPLQEGVGYRSQVWLAAQSGLFQNSPAAPVVFKFVIPSNGDIPDGDLSDKGVFTDMDRGRYFIFPYDLVKGEAASYRSLADFQGSTLPYFYGVHQVTMPWGEPAWMLAFEWIPGTPGSLYHLNNVLTDGGETKYRDFEPFMRLFHSALDTLQSAHKRNINHADVRAANILIDEARDQVVWIDWTSNSLHPDPDARIAWGFVEYDQLKYAFVKSGIEPQCSEIRRICKELIPTDTDSEDSSSSPSSGSSSSSSS
ncbi:hypothetical protein K466DRAFT_597266 [Polyporus arcularius HHB13444]|uniref:Uncharacterized protein n=1 Tax=Polyporus arcularius HHB13444 TaxID=1314778 RepID=A0A5C3PP33_9APHY|nr:hypothetical protein K466DRAFT_597266 [Polyporus arcularius HHB13444]